MKAAPQSLPPEIQEIVDNFRAMGATIIVSSPKERPEPSGCSGNCDGCADMVNEIEAHLKATAEASAKARADVDQMVASHLRDLLRARQHLLADLEHGSAPDTAPPADFLQAQVVHLRNLVTMFSAKAAA